MNNASGSTTSRSANWVRASVATRRAKTSRTSFRARGDTAACCSASLVQTKTGYATTSVIRNEDRAIQGMQTLSAAAKYDSRVRDERSMEERCQQERVELVDVPDQLAVDAR